MKKSILLVNPNYHYSFTLRNELQKLGWKADIYVYEGYPRQLLFKDDVIYEKGPNSTGYFRRLHYLWRIYFFIKIIFTYNYFYVYGDAEVFTLIRNSKYKLINKIINKTISPELRILKSLGKKIIFFPNGCHQEVLKSDFQKFDGGQLCGNCILPSAACNDIDNQLLFDKVNKFHDFVVANTPMNSTRLNAKIQIKDRFIDIEDYYPNLIIPDQFLLPKTNSLRILHSFVDEGRTSNSKNVKGSQHVFNAVCKLKEEGYLVEYFYLNKIHMRDMKYYQAQCDIAVDQLIYGWWGSTSIECMALGKPVVCYLNPELKNEFFKSFTEYESLPIIEADITTIYHVLKKLVLDAEYRKTAGKESRKFSEKHFDARLNSKLFSDLFISL